MDVFLFNVNFAEASAPPPLPLTGSATAKPEKNADLKFSEQITL